MGFIGNSKIYEMQEKLIARNEAATEKMAATLTTLGKIMEGTKSMMSNLVQNIEVDFESKKRKSNESIDLRKVRVLDTENNDKLNKCLQFINKVEDDSTNHQICIKGDYKLTQKSNLDIWLDYLKHDLLNLYLLDVIDSTVQGPENLSEIKTLKRKNIVRGLIIRHLDESYHKRVISVSDPREIIHRLRGFRRNVSNMTHSSVRTKLYQIKMTKDEKVNDFCERFDSIIREYEACEDTVPLTEQEIRSAFYQAVSSTIVELRNADLMFRQSHKKEMSLEEIKSFLLHLEEEIKTDTKEEITVQRAYENNKRTSENKCFR